MTTRSVYTVLTHQIQNLQDRWTWVPNWIDAPARGEAGRLVTFRRQLKLSCDPVSPVLIRLTADTRYKLIINGKRAMVGPSRGSDKIWYYDTVDIAPFLQCGANTIVVKVLRFFPGIIAAVPFARASLPGLAVLGNVIGVDISTGKTDSEWEGRVDDQIFYTGKNPDDIFLHVSALINGNITDASRCMRTSRTLHLVNGASSNVTNSWVTTVSYPRGDSHPA